MFEYFNRIALPATAKSFFLRVQPPTINLLLEAGAATLKVGISRFWEILHVP